jgi:hypothetical protein
MASSTLLLAGCEPSISDPLGVKKFYERIVTFPIEFQQNVFKFSYDLLVWIFDFLSQIVLTTPVLLFDNSWFKTTLLSFAVISVTLISALTMIEGIKRMLGIGYTNMRNVLVKLPVALAVTGFAPFIFVEGAKLLNKASDLILNMGTSKMYELSTYNSYRVTSMASAMDTIALILFDGLFIYLCFPIILYHGRRWFDLIALGVMTPLAMTSWLFNGLSRFHAMWWSSLKALSLVQLMYAVFITLLALIMFAIPFPTTWAGMMTKLLVILGGLYRMAYPPHFVRAMTDRGDSVWTMANNTRNSVRDNYKSAKNIRTNAIEGYGKAKIGFDKIKKIFGK